jgi:hypothetical protein
VVFGSFLSDSEMLGDVDLSLMYTRRNENPNDWDVLSEARVKDAQAKGRNFRNIFEQWEGRRGKSSSGYANDLAV